jgi:hypothetical protein
MGRPVIVRGVPFAGRIAWEGRITRVLAAADRGDVAPEVATALEAIADGRALVLAPESTMTAWTWNTLRALQAYVHARASWLRRCKACRRWFLAHQNRVVLCGRQACDKAEAIARAKSSTKIEKDKRRAALRQVVPNSTR